MMRDEFREEADAVARKHNLPHPLHEEIRIRGLRVDQFQFIDPNHPNSPYDQGVELIDQDRNVVARKITDHVARSAIAAMDEILTREIEAAG